MKIGLSKVLSLTLCLIGSFTGVGIAQAHSLAYPTLPLHHGAVYGGQLAKFIVHGKANVFTGGAAGFSASSRAQGAINKNLVSSAFSTGQSVSFSQQLSQQITNGQLYGRTYYNLTGNTYSTLPPAVYALGSNPLNGATTSPVTISNFNSNALTVSPISVMKSITSGSSALRSLAGPKLVSESGSFRALENQQKNIATGGYNAGYQNVANIFKSPIVGGQFSGTYYLGTGGGNYTLDLADAPNGGKFIFAFGNSPLFNAPSSLVITNPASYISFASGRTLSITNGLLAYTRYVQSGSSSTFTLGSGGLRLLAIGSNPYNNPIPSVHIPSGTLSYLLFK